MEKVYLNANIRNEVGKGAVKKLRNMNIIPAVVYEKGEKAISLKLLKKDLFKILHTSAGENVIINLTVTVNGESEDKTVIIKEIQHNPVKGDILHVDFNKISLTQTLTVNVPIEARGEPVGVKEGGILEHILWEIEVECLPTDIPEKIEVDVSNLGIGDSIFVKNLSIPKDVKILSNTEAIILSIKHPVVEKVEEKVEEEIAEPEVIREKKVEEAETTESE